MEPQTEFKDDLKAFKEHVKMFKALAVGKAPKGDHRDYKYRGGAPVKGQNGKLWKSIRIYHVNRSDDEHMERVWVRAPKNVSVTKPKSPRPQNKKAMKGRQFGNLDDFKGQVKILKDLAKGKGPVKAPGHYSSDVEVKGRDGKMWRTFRVYHIDEQGDERYELVWIRDMSQDDRSRYV